MFKIEFRAPFEHDPPFSCIMGDGGPLFPLSDVMTLFACDDDALWSIVLNRSLQNHLTLADHSLSVSDDVLTILAEQIEGAPERAPIARRFLLTEVLPVLDRLALGQGANRAVDVGSFEPRC